MCALVHRGPPLLQWRTQALRRLLWQGSWRGNTGRRSGTTGTSRVGPYRRPLLPLYFHPSACLVIDGKVVAFAEEERFSRRRHHKDSRSCAVAAAYCLSEAGITLADVDEIAIAFNPAWPTPSNICTDAELIAELLAPALFGHHRPRQVTVVEHHLAHAASAFHPSGFDEAAAQHRPARSLVDHRPTTYSPHQQTRTPQPPTRPLTHSAAESLVGLGQVGCG
ncbi:carbamoyltransferase N-terminal domain-containing protein [Streptomyces sp. NPDC058619]|uniref:carbamoyltransferase N-terminal domain-containing protein n=1 Tax=unclassified Streptomyces TaxID=2593676 RepID=UPI00364DD38C